MTAEKFCRVCKNKNAVDAAKCDYCGAPFREGSQEPITTVPVVGAQPDLILKSSQHLQELAKYPVDALVLFIMDDEQPLVIRNTHKVVLGRNVSNIPPVVFDLSTYGAAELGVSRQHAMITAANDAYSLTDLGSTNGTWLNASRLVAQKPYPLHSGDQVRLGNLKLFVYFRTAEVSPGATEEIILLVEEPHLGSSLHPRMTARYLSATIHPFLQAMVDLQNAIEVIQGQPPREVIINTISAMRQDLPLGISITGAAQAIKLTKEMIVPWRRERADALNTVFAGQAAQPSDGPIDTAPRPPAAQPGPHATRIIKEADISDAASKQVMNALQEDLLRLAQEIVDTTTSDLSTADRSTYIAKIMPALRNLAVSRLQIALEKPGSAQ